VHARHGAQVCAAAQALADTLHIPLLVQCHRPADAGHELTAEWLRPGQSAEVHAKSALVPLYERPLLASPALQAGAAGALFALDAQRRVIPALCYELYSDAHLRHSVLAGGQFVAHMASFAAFAQQPIDRWEQPMARLRAIAWGTPILRAGNRAQGGWIDAQGRVRVSTPRFAQEARCLPVWAPGGAPTLYARAGPSVFLWPAAVLLLCTALLRRHRLTSVFRLPLFSPRSATAKNVSPERCVHIFPRRSS
jgi:apolipoprotein N-acyltransferase